MLITVITCTYQKFDNLFLTVDSVLAQDYPEIEYIITDDGSDDFPMSMIKNYVESHKKHNIKNFIVLAHKVNKGTVSNMNSAYHVAKGEYIVHLAGDDIFYDCCVLTKISKVLKKKQPVILSTSMLAVDVNLKPQFYSPHKRAIKRINKLDTNKKQYEALLSGYYYGMASGATFCLNREKLIEIGYGDEKYRLWDDAPLLASFLWKYKMDTAYDIISIYYGMGGVSSGDHINPLLKKDGEVFYSTDVMKHYDQLSLKCRAAIDIQHIFGDSKTIGRMVKAITKHPIASLRRIVYFLNQKLDLLVDRHLIENMKRGSNQL